MVLFLEYLWKYKKILFGSMIAAIINQVFSLLDPQIFRLIIDRYAMKAGEIPQDVFLKGVGLLLLAFVFVSLISRIAKNVQDYLVNVVTQKVGTEIYSDSVSHVFSLPYKTFEDKRSGEILQKMQKAKMDSQSIIESLINTVFLSLVGVVFVLGYSFYVHWTIGVAFLIFIPVLVIFVSVISKKIKSAQKEIVRVSSELAGSTTETIRNVELVKSIGLEKQEIERLNKVNQQILKLELKKILLLRRLSFIQGTLVNATRAVLLFLMLYLIVNGQITLGEFFTLTVYSLVLFNPLGELASVVSKYQEAKASNEELEKILNIEVEPRKENLDKIKDLKSIEFSSVSFSYGDKTNEAISNINLKMTAGKTIAFVGPSGSGKSTVVKLLVGLYNPSEGKIKINKTDSNNVDFDYFRKLTGLVSQETQLFAGTIRDNLLFVNPDASDEDCLNALEIASAKSIIERANGLDTIIGEGGIKLSGGERQRIAIARAILRKPKLLVFDEATSSLDSITEKQITETIREVTKKQKDSINIMIAHRLSTIYHADEIYVLEKGRVVEKGTHNALLKKKGLYYALWREQVGEN